MIRSASPLALLLAGLAVVSPLRAQAACIEVRAGHVLLPDRVEKSWTVRWENDRITAVGANLAPAGCEHLDRPEHWLTPGLVEVGSEMGLVEIGMEGASVDADAEQADPVRAEFRAWDAYNPASTVIPVTRMEGVSSAFAAPRGGLVAGQGAWVSLSGATQAETLVKGPVGMWAGPMATGSKAEGLARLRELLADARLYAQRRSEWERGELRPLAGTRGDLEALQAVLQRQIPLVLAADRAADIELLARFAEEERVLVVIAGGAEAWTLAPRLAKAGIAVIVDPYSDGASSFDAVRGRADNARLLHDAGVTLLVSTFSTHHARTLRQVAGNAVREGLPHLAALQAITATPARVFGVPTRGAIGPGLVADLVLWTGDPLELLTTCEALWIEGQPVSMSSRQRELWLKYRELPGTPVDPLPLP